MSSEKIDEIIENLLLRKEGSLTAVAIEEMIKRIVAEAIKKHGQDCVSFASEDNEE